MKQNKSYAVYRTHIEARTRGKHTSVDLLLWSQPRDSVCRELQFRRNIIFPSLE